MEKGVVKTSLSFVTILVLFFAISAPVFSQSSEESAGRAAEQAGTLREALTHYVAALQSASEGSADEQRLRETIIKLVQKLSPVPAIPEEARRFSVRGQIAIKEAKSPSDFDEAAKEFGKALRVAPWWADGYVNQGVALEKAGKYTEAIRSLKFYLLAAPAAPDTEKIKEQIYALEYRQERAAKESTAKRDEQRKQDLIRSLAGTWEGRITRASGSAGDPVRFVPRVQGNTVELSPTAFFYPPSNRWVAVRADKPVTNFRGAVDGATLTGTVTIDYSSEYAGGRVFTGRFSGSISPDGTSLQITYTIAEPCCGWVTRDGDLARGGGFQEMQFSGEFRRR